MKQEYNGYEINVSREKSCAGYDLLYYQVMRISDKLFIIDDYEDSEEEEKDMVQYLKNRVDEFIRTKGASEGLDDFYY